MHKDLRGSFHEWVNPQVLQSFEVPFKFAQANMVESRINVIRGLHFSKKPQIKIVTCVSGKIRDAVLDIRTSSPTFGQYAYFDIDSHSRETVVIEPGLAHGYEVITDSALVVYLTNLEYDADDDFSINPIEEIKEKIWVTKTPVTSMRDQESFTLNHFLKTGVLNSLDF